MILSSGIHRPTGSDLDGAKAFSDQMVSQEVLTDAHFCIHQYLSGELVCFFLTSQTRIHSNGVRRHASPSPSVVSRGVSIHATFRPFMAAAGQLTHAMRGLTKLTNDGSGIPLEPEPRTRSALSLNGFTDNPFIGPVVSLTIDRFFHHAVDNLALR